MEGLNKILELKARLEKVKIGEKLTLKVLNYFGSIIDVKVTYFGDIKQHGYVSPYGSWGLYKINDNEVECYKALFRQYKKRIKCYIKLGFTIQDFKIGW